VGVNFLDDFTGSWHFGPPLVISKRKRSFENYPHLGVLPSIRSEISMWLLSI
jgi:hypothetical protein